jgi:VanZ family protein
MKHGSAVLAGWLPAAAFMFLISCLSHIPGDEIDLPPFPFADKIIHFSVYTVLGCLLQLRGPLMNRMGVMKAAPSLFIGILAGTLHGILDEIHQMYVPFRDFSYYDMAADMLGVVTGILATAKLMARCGCRCKGH